MSGILPLPDHRDTGNQEPDRRWKIGDDRRAPSAGIVETAVVNRAAIHCWNARNTERRSYISHQPGPFGQHPGGEGRVTGSGEKHCRHGEGSGTIIDEERALDQSPDCRRIGFAAQCVENRAAFEPIGNQGHRQPDQDGPEDKRANPFVIRPRLPDQVAKACCKHHHGNVNALVEQYSR